MDLFLLITLILWIILILFYFLIIVISLMLNYKSESKFILWWRTHICDKVDKNH